MSPPILSERKSEPRNRASVTRNRGIKVVRTITVNRPVRDLYNFWRNFENLPKFMTHLQSVQVLDSKRSIWVAKGPVGRPVQWEAEIINEHVNELIAWRSREGSDIHHAGSIRFKEVRKGTEITVSLEYIPPAGVVGKFLAKWFGEEPDQQIHDDLRRVKSFLETGEIPSIDGQPHGPKK